MQKHQLASVFRKAADLLGVGVYPPTYAAPAIEMIQFLTFMAEQIEKDLQNATPSPGEADNTRPEA